MVFNRELQEMSLLIYVFCSNFKLVLKKYILYMSYCLNIHISDLLQQRDQVESTPHVAVCLPLIASLQQQQMDQASLTFGL